MLLCYAVCVWSMLCLCCVVVVFVVYVLCVGCGYGGVGICFVLCGTNTNGSPKV